MDLLAAKLLSLAGIAIASLAFGLFPTYLVSWFKSRGVLRTPRARVCISAVICFSGGTLLGVAFLHLMPDMREKLAVIGWSSYWDSLSLSDTITCGGFFFVYIFDELMHIFIEWYTSRDMLQDSNPSLAMADAFVPSATSVNIGGCKNATTQTHEIHPSHLITDEIQRIERTGPSNVTSDLPEVAERRKTTKEVHVKGSVHLEQRAGPRMGYHEHEHDPHSTGHPMESTLLVPPLTGLLTIIALSFHDVFEGLAIGIESKPRDVLFLFLSIAAHKYAISFCIGMDLALSGTKAHLIMLYMFTFSLVSPLGIVIGMVIVAQQKDMAHSVQIDTPVTVILQGLAGGTLIYVVCFEVLQREGSATHAKGVFNVIFVLIGFLLTLGLKIMCESFTRTFLRATMCASFMETL